MNYRRVFIENGYVHLIIVAYNRQPIFIQNINLLKQAIINSEKYFNYELIAICVLPEHIHMILYPENIKDYPKIITSIKYYFSHNIDVGVETPIYGYLNNGGKGIFQRRYFEHTIIDEKDLNNQINYILYNPVKHGYAKSVKDWKYSSFHKFVKNKFYDINWGSNTDIKEIIDLNFE